MAHPSTLDLHQIECYHERGSRATQEAPIPPRFGLVAEGSTPEEALDTLRQVVAQRLAAGAQVVPLDVPDTGHPWMRFAGTLKDDPLLEDWKRAMAESRQSVENDNVQPG